MATRGFRANRALLAALAFCACARTAEVKPEPREPPPNVAAPAPAPPPPRPRTLARAEPPPSVIFESGLRIEYRPQALGQTMVEVVEPEGTEVQAFDGSALVASDTAPLAFDARPDHYYRLVMRLPSGALREKKLRARAGQTVSVKVIDKGPSAPQPMTEKDFRALRSALDLETGDAAKLSVLRSTASNAWFTTAQVGAIIDRITYRDNKLAVLPILKDRILDQQNAYRLYRHFSYREDKAKVQEMLER